MKLSGGRSTYLKIAHQPAGSRLVVLCSPNLGRAPSAMQTRALTFLHKNSTVPQPSASTTLPPSPLLMKARRIMSSTNHALYYSDIYPYDPSYYGELDGGSAHATAGYVVDTKSNKPTRSSSFADIRNLPGPSVNHEPISPPFLPSIDPWDKNTCPLLDLPLLYAPLSPQPPTRVPSPPNSGFPAGLEVEGWWNDEDPSASVLGPSTLHGSLEGSSTYMSADADGAYDGLPDFGDPWNPASPFQTSGFGGFEYDIWARREQELLKVADDAPEEAGLPPSAFTLQAIPPSTSEDVDDVAEPLREIARESQPAVEVIMASSRKGKEVAREAATRSTSSAVSRKPKRKREEEAAASVEADLMPAPALKQRKMTPEEADEMMVPPKQYPTQCGCGTGFDELTVSCIVDHFTGHYSDEQKAGQTKLRCRWSKCSKALTYGELVRHVKVDHIGVQWACADCGQTFTRANGVTRHKQSSSACKHNQAAAKGRT